MVSSVFSTMKRCGEYGANYLLGTGSQRVGKEIGLAIQAHSKAGMSLPKSVITGFSKGVARTNKDLAKTGYFKHLGATFSAIGKEMSAGWKGAKGFSKLTKAIKPLGKAMPFIMNALWLAQSIPDIVSRTKDEGIWGGIKETGKALANMAIFATASAVGATFGTVAMLALPIAVSMITTPLIGEPYSAKKAKEEEAQKQAQNQAGGNPFEKEPVVGQKLDVTSKV